MAARVYDIYDLSSPFVSATAQTPTPTTPTTARRTASARIMRGGAYLLTFAGAALLAALLVTVTPLGRIDADITVPFVAVTLGALALMAWDVMRA